MTKVALSQERKVGFTWNLINVIHHISRMKEKNPTIIILVYA